MPLIVTSIPQLSYTVMDIGFERAKPTLKMLPASKILLYFGKGNISFYPRKMVSIGQRASKILALKVGVLKKKSATRPCAQGPTIIKL